MSGSFQSTSMGTPVADASSRRVETVADTRADNSQPSSRYFIKEQHQLHRRGSGRGLQAPTICSPEAESQLQAFEHDRASHSFLSTMEETRSRHPRLHTRILHNAVTALLESRQTKVFFALDHSTINTRDGYSIMAPKEPLFFDDPVYIAVIKRSNISFILKCIEQILPALECSQYVKQTLEDICEENKRLEANGETLHYYGILEELSLTFQEL